MITRRTVVALLASPPLLTGCGAGAEATGRRSAAGPAPETTRTGPAPAGTPLTRTAAEPARPGIPGLGPRRSAAIPDHCRQAVVVTGRGEDSPVSTVVLHERTAAAGWWPGPAWPAHDALRGWSAHQMAGDLHSPVGAQPVAVMGHADWLAG
ncbi:hypothetical protein [Streptomyces sp. NPDC047028]|uniref:hypothetical protein n=1 Tax=Streptomyces sp. NPDC047028 TaxID=3155793 RepID=UPI0033D89806